MSGSCRYPLKKYAQFKRSGEIESEIIGFETVNWDIFRPNLWYPTFFEIVGDLVEDSVIE